MTIFIKILHVKIKEFKEQHACALHKHASASLLKFVILTSLAAQGFEKKRRPFFTPLQKLYCGAWGKCFARDYVFYSLYKLNSLKLLHKN